MKTPPPNSLVKKVNSSREIVKSVVTALRHQEYGLMEILHVGNDYDPKISKLALIVTGYQLDDLIGQLRIVREWIQEASDCCET